MVTANNHSCDRGGDGIKRTLDVLDEMELSHTGTFRDKEERDSANLLILENDYLKVGLLNYTYGTNGLPAPEPTIVNLIDKDKIQRDIVQSRFEKLDKLIIMLHWGLEYQVHPK